MKTILLISLQMLNSLAFASGVWIQGPDVSRSEFESFMRQQGDSKTYVQFMLSKLRPSEIQPDALQGAQNILEQKNISFNFPNDFENIESQGVMDRNHRGFLKNFLQKLKDKNPGDKIVSRLLCKWSSFPGEADADKSCFPPPQSLSALSAKLSKYDTLLLEDLAVSLAPNASIAVDPNEIFNWRLLSNSRRTISFRGSLQDLRTQEFRSDELIQGDCESFSHGLDDMELVSTASVYFNDACMKSLKEPETSRSEQWLKENKSWVIPAGIAVLGVLAYQLKDKRLVIEKPSFR